MNKDRAHDVLHIWHGNKSENCPVCNKTMHDEAEIINAAQQIAAEQYYPRINPNLPYDALYFNEDGTPKTTTQEQPAAPVKAGESVKEAKTPVAVMTDVMSFSEDSKTVPTRIKIIPTGTFNTPKYKEYGALEITKEKLLEMKKNFEAGVRAGGTRTGLPIDIEHGETHHRDAAAGWMKGIHVFDDGAYADVEWTSLGKNLLEEGIYKFFSPEFVFDYLSNEQSDYFSNVATGGGLVNKPLFDKSLPPIMCGEGVFVQNLTTENSPTMLFISNQSGSHVSNVDQSGSLLTFSEKEEKPMDLQTILAKDKSARTSDEQLFLFNNMTQLTDDQKVAEGFVVTAPETKVEPPKEAPTQDAPVVPTVTASEQGKTISASEEIADLRARLVAAEANAQKGTLAFAELQVTKKELEEKKVTEEIKAFTFSENGGKIAPAQVTPIVSLMMTMSEPQRVELKGILSSLPDRKVFGEVGSDEDLDKSKAADSFQALLNEETQKVRQANPNFSMSDATRQATIAVVAKHRDLYEASLQPSQVR